LRNDKSGLENLNDLAALIHRPAEKDYGAAIGSRARWRDLDDFAIVAKLRWKNSRSSQPSKCAPMPCFACKGPSPSAGSGDIIDAALIAACTAAVETYHAPPDSRFATLAEHLTFIEQIEEDIARGKSRREGYQTPALEAGIEAEISRLKKRRAVELKRLLAILRAHADLANRFDLLISVPGIGERTAIALLIRMRELGTLSRVKQWWLLLGLPLSTTTAANAREAAISPADMITSGKVSTPPPCPQLSNGIQPWSHCMAA
jgi:hypothetical protein